MGSRSDFEMMRPATLSVGEAVWSSERLKLRAACRMKSDRHIYVSATISEFFNCSERLGRVALSTINLAVLSRTDGVEASLSCGAVRTTFLENEEIRHAFDGRCASG